MSPNPQKLIDKDTDKAYFRGEPTVEITGNLQDVHRLTQPFGFVSARLNQLIEIEKGFETNLDSLPRIPLIYVLLKNRGPWAAIVHDYLYRFGTFKKHRFTRKEADQIYLEALKAEEVSFMIRWLLYLGVRATGWYHWSKYRSGEWSNTLEL